MAPFSPQRTFLTRHCLSLTHSCALFSTRAMPLQACMRALGPHCPCMHIFNEVHGCCEETCSNDHPRPWYLGLVLGHMYCGRQSDL